MNLFWSLALCAGIALASLFILGDKTIPLWGRVLVAIGLSVSGYFNGRADGLRARFPNER